MFGGKENDVRMDLAYFIQIVYVDTKIAFEITKYQYDRPLSYWRRLYPTLKQVYRIYGKNPGSYAWKEEVI